MDKFLKLDVKERSAIIVNTAKKRRISEAIVEKDFWVCWTLDYLFNKFKYKDYICFKGGTSLSKAYHCIKRFSEDIDLVLDWKTLLIDEEEVYLERSKRKQEQFNQLATKKTEEYLINNWLPIMKNDFKSMLTWDFDLYIDQEDMQTICFQYPRSFDEPSILQVIRLEIGVLAEPFPYEDKNISSYIVEEYPKIFDQKEFSVKVVDIDRTFFEKITILHREANRENGNFPKRYSRHFYDVYQMIQSGIASESLSNLDILQRVVNFMRAIGQNIMIHVVVNVN